MADKALGRILTGCGVEGLLGEGECISLLGLARWWARQLYTTPDDVQMQLVIFFCNGSRPE